MGKLVTGTSIAQILAVVASPLVTRLYAPDAFGVWMVFSSVVGVVAGVACLRYELAIMLPDDDEEAAQILWISVASATLVGGLTALVVIPGGSTISTWLNAPALTSCVWLAPISVFFIGVSGALNYWNSCTRKYGRLSVARVGAAAATHARRRASTVALWARRREGQM